MRRIQLLATVILALVVALAIACNGDGGDNGDGETPDGSATATSTATATPSNGDTPDDGTITPAPDKSPVDGNGDIPTGDGQPSTNGATPAAVGTPTVHVPDSTAWQKENYPGVVFDQIDCVFNPATVVVTCPGYGEFAPNPPLVGEDIGCLASLVNDEPVAITCTSQSPLTSIFYEVQR